MNEIHEFGLIVLVVVGGVRPRGPLRAGAQRAASRTRPALFLSPRRSPRTCPALGGPALDLTVERIGVVALIVILFDGGMQIGWRRFRTAAVPILSSGSSGRSPRPPLVAVAAHWLLDFSWTVRGPVGAALAPTDPAVMFSVLGGRRSAAGPARSSRASRGRTTRSGSR